VYLFLLAFAPMKQTIRILGATVLGALCFWYGHAYLFGFLAGHLMAELSNGANTSLLPIAKPEPGRSVTRSVWTMTISAISLVGGIYILCLPHRTEGTFPPDYRALGYIKSPYWDDALVRVYVWHTVGAILAVAGISKLSIAQAALNSRKIQFLGHISFPVYLIHIAYISILRRRILDLVCWICTGYEYEWNLIHGTAATFAFAWMGSVIVVLAAVIFSSVYLAQWIDQKPIAWAKKFEEWCLARAECI
jgi:peptidoglycan/LPS O-acetylase OafA/YrhL